ncbi:TAXI family TRAP transporter solute-binding subunit [Phocicoccus pinnipedialis]|uniref:Alkanesulfonate transporter substrate-binding subunit n=1 Tax=Phocicoccus pinnipedialis TaxID=110845 RepID=A0A6V7RGR0_9BACL|nr:TAXI family TRAP transporter solute-binding subunit [Jeotgalicoccus pinnipedialis]MBP1939069.1 TRAP transporter TAXI family solute receptor [Jeotgalicoccus pinnipedialis]CAD2076935.1 alkanesulfonate transporter substrate-binding subunit [Jeotgalicoccus pinnipedialis]
MYKRIVMVLFAAVALFLTACSNDKKENEDTSSDNKGLDTKIVTIATGGSSGPYNIIATTLADGYSKEFGVNSRTQTTGASVENLNLMAQEKVEMSFVMSDALMQALEGTDAFKEKIENVQILANLYPNYVQVITTGKTGIENIEDLKGKRVAVGDQGSGVEIATKAVLEAHGITYDDIEVDYLGYAEAADALKSGTIDVAFTTSGLPNASVMELQNSVDLKIVPIEEEAVKRLQESVAIFESLPIPAGTYGNDEDIPTAAIRNALVVRSDLSEDDVYKLTKYLFENLDKLENSHQAAKDITLEEAQKISVGELHPGAKRYYDEQ